MTRLALVCALLALPMGVCAQAETAQSVQPAQTAPTVDDILSSKTNDGDYAKTQRCIRGDAIMQTRILNDRYIVFETGRSERWLVKLSQTCPGLNPDSKLQFETRSARLCEWDDVRVLLDNGIGYPMPGPRCQLPSFQQVSKEQVDQLREALKLERDAQH